jgi:hypothetical protein
LSEQELQQLVEYFSILQEWSLERNDVKDRGDDISTTKASTSVEGTKAAQARERPKSASVDRRSRCRQMT